MNKGNCALKLVNVISLYYDARSKNLQVINFKFSSKYFLVNEDKRCILGNAVVSLGWWSQTLQRNAATLSLGSPSPRDLLNMKPPCAAERSGNTNQN